MLGAFEDLLVFYEGLLSNLVLILLIGRLLSVRREAGIILLLRKHANVFLRLAGEGIASIHACQTLRIFRRRRHRLLHTFHRPGGCAKPERHGQCHCRRQ